ncbi:MAG: type I 3-dehydroquinate dehydratase, partial [Thermoguttaceae bacterium]
MICVSIACGSHRRMIAEHLSLADEGVQLVELRLDFLRGNPDLGRLLPDRPTPVVATVRRRQDGGNWRETEEKRLLLLRSAIVAGVEFVDLEEDIAASIPRFGKTKRIVSFHDMNGTPDDLAGLCDRMRKCDPDVIKIAVKANRIADVFRVMQLTKNQNELFPEVPVIGISMGEIGIMSRILAHKLGSPFTYATFSKSRVFAPGLLEYTHLRDFYRFDGINPKTEVYAVLGNPIKHSLSPLIHNAGFAQDDMDRIYVPQLLATEDLHDYLRFAPEFDIRGLSVTIPHKVAILKELTQFDPAVEEIGACNTVIIDSQERYGYNTDYVAAMIALEIAMNGGNPGNQSPLLNKRSLVLGAGGVGKAIAYGLLQRGAKVIITDIDDKQGQQLAEQLGCDFVEWELRHGIRPQVLLNCTPVGMHPLVDATPFEKSGLDQDTLVFDSVYNPENTLLIKQARAKGCTVVSGVEMFIGQACM